MSRLISSLFLVGMMVKHTVFNSVKWLKTIVESCLLKLRLLFCAMSLSYVVIFALNESNILKFGSLNKCSCQIKKK